MLFTEVDFLDRFERASRIGFKAVEFLFPYAYEAGRLADLLKKYNLEQVLINMPAGKWDAGERGIAALPDRKAEFEDGVDNAIRYAKALDCKQVNCLAGITLPNVPSEIVHETIVANLRFAARALEREGIRLLVEAINTRDMPGFHLYRTADARSLIQEVNHPNLFYQYDIYHMQVMEGDLTATIRDNIKIIGHIQVADNPGRHEPGTGEINFPNLFRSIDETGYTGYVGCEYKPLTTTEAGLDWVKPYL